MAEILRASILGQIPHGFSTREGLTSADILPNAVLLSPKQVHSPDVAVVRAGWEEPPEVDALVTDRRGLLLGIVTADCAPVLLADPEAGIVGAAHAGWRGAFGGVLENTVATMQSLGADPARILAAIGPTIAQASYEVDEAFRLGFGESESRFFREGKIGHWQFDLPAYVAARLRRAGIGMLEDLAQDTYAQSLRFHSYRRKTHCGEDTAGRQLSVIGLPAL